MTRSASLPVAALIVGGGLWWAHRDRNRGATPDECRAQYPG
ncbi:MAG: hypothetical protein ABIJ48_01905 [Actinomycetota bacterium]